MRVVSLAILSAWTLALLPGATAGADGFALVSPSTCEALAALAGTPEAQSVIRSAEEAMKRAAHPLPVLHTEGTLPHRGIYDQSVEAARDLPAIRDLALAWRLTGKRAYAESCGLYLASWLGVYRPSLNPIDETRFDAFLVAFDMVHGSLRAETESRMAGFLREMAEGYLGERDGTRETDRNNWQSHRVKLGAMAAFSLGDGTLVGRAEAAFRRQLDANLMSDGSVLDFGIRDALHYVVYDLEPLLTAALAARAHGLEWYRVKNREGLSLEDALAWLAPYAEGRATHEEFLRSAVRFDARRREAGVKGFGGTWDPKGAAVLYHMAARLDPRWQALAAGLGKPQAWTVLLLGGIGGSADPGGR